MEWKCYSVNKYKILFFFSVAIGADIVDSTNQNVVKFGELTEEYSHFALNENQRNYFNAKSGFNSYLREEYHALNKILWKDDFLSIHTQMPRL